MNKNYNLKSVKYEMATDVVISQNTYAGVLSLPYLAPSVKLAETVARGFVTELDGITKDAVVNTLTAGTMIKAPGCAWNTDTNLAVGESVLTVVDMKVNETICRATLYPTWIGSNFSGRNGAIPSDFSTFLLSTVANKTAAEIEDRIWVGGATPTVSGFLSNDGVFDRPGYAQSQLLGATEAPILAITAANIIANFGIVYAKANASVPGIMGKPDTQFLVNQQTFGFYMQALGSAASLQGVNSQGTNQGFASLQYLGVDVNVCPGMPNDAIIMCQKSNLFYGTNLGADTNEVKMIPFYEYDGSDNVGIAMKFAIGVKAGIKTDVVVGAIAATLPS